MQRSSKDQSLQSTVNERQGTTSGKSTLKARWLEHLHDMRSGYVGLKQSQSHLQLFHTERTGPPAGCVSTEARSLLLFSQLERRRRGLNLHCGIFQHSAASQRDPTSPTRPDAKAGKGRLSDSTSLLGS